MEKEIELPAWFELIQTDRDYYIDAYKKQLNGVNKFNYKVLLSSLFAGNFYLLYKKFGLLRFFVSSSLFPLIGVLIFGMISIFLLSPLPISEINFDDIFENNIYLVYMCFGYFFVVITSSYLFFSRQYNRWYLNSIKKKYIKG